MAEEEEEEPSVPPVTSTCDIGVQYESWRRILWQPQIFDDDYVDPASLAMFVFRGLATEPYNYRQVVVTVAVAIVPQLCVLAIVMGAWLRISPYTAGNEGLFYPRAMTFL